MPRADGIDAEHLDQVIKSAGYAAIAGRIRLMYETKLRDLARPLSAEQTAMARGFLEGVAACERVPGILRGEMARERKARRRGV